MEMIMKKRNAIIIAVQVIMLTVSHCVLSLKKCSFVAPIKFIGAPKVSYNSVKIYYTSSLSTQCRLDWGTFEYCKSPYQQSNLKPGRHTLAVRNTGKTGCQEQNSVSFYIRGINVINMKSFIEMLHF